jgi:hypothetical protein
MNEQNKSVSVPARGSAKAHFSNDNSYTIEFLLSTGAIPNDSKESFEGYLTSICEAEMKYANHVITWSFIASQRLLRLQQRRLRTIKQALVERLDKFPLPGANGVGFDNPDPNADPNPPNPSDMVVEEGEEIAASAEDIDLVLFQRGETGEDNFQSEIRPGQEGPGGWVF